MPCGCKSKIKDLSYVQQIAKKYSVCEKKDVYIFKRNGHYDFAEKEYIESEGYTTIEKISFN